MKKATYSHGVTVFLKTCTIFRVLSVPHSTGRYAYMEIVLEEDTMASTFHRILRVGGRDIPATKNLDAAISGPRSMQTPVMPYLNEEFAGHCRCKPDAQASRGTPVEHQLMHTLHPVQLLRIRFEPTIWPEDPGVWKEYIIHEKAGQIESYIGAAGNEDAVQSISTFRHDTLAERCDGRKNTKTFLDACL